MVQVHPVGAPPDQAHDHAVHWSKSAADAPPTAEPTLRPGEYEITCRIALGNADLTEWTTRQRLRFGPETTEKPIVLRLRPAPRSRSPRTSRTR